MGKTIAFIPVRGGSKSIPLKNIKLFNNKPLVYWVLLAANNSDYIDEVIVSTDSDEIRNVVEQFNFSKTLVVKRKSSLAGDNSSTESVMVDYAINNQFDDIVLLQATSPLTTSDNINEALKIYFESSANSLISVVKTHRFLWKFKSEVIEPTNYDYTKRPRRQDWDGQLVENGAIYITSRGLLVESRSRISGEITSYVMPQYTYYEIDEPSDWAILESIHKQFNKIDIEKELRKSLGQIKMVITDVDGVLTNSGMLYIDGDLEAKQFNTKDGMGVEILKRNKIACAIITGESHSSVIRRAKKLNIDEVYIGIKNKLEIVNRISMKYKLGLNEIAYIGDDINDLESMKSVGLSIAVGDAVEEVKSIASIILKTIGGAGAFREFVDLLISSRS
jgi:N-acylneuraminate cytidylyltransferase